jgi:hypothetical protein
VAQIQGFFQAAVKDAAPGSRLHRLASAELARMPGRR